MAQPHKIYSSFRQNQSLSVDFGEEDPSIIPNALLPEIPLLETVLQLRNENLTEQILEKTHFNFSLVNKTLNETKNSSKIQFKKYDKVNVLWFISSFETLLKGSFKTGGCYGLATEEFDCDVNN